MEGAEAAELTLMVAVVGVLGALETVFNCSMAIFVGVDGREETFVAVVVVVLPMGELMATAVVRVLLPVRLPPAAAFIMDAMAKIGF